MAWSPDYVTTAELSSFARLRDQADEAELARAIAAASRSIDQSAGRQFGQVASPERRSYRSRWDDTLCRWYAEIDDLMVAPTAVATDPAGDDTYTGDVGTSYVLRPVNAAAKSGPWTRLEFTSGATYYPTGPERYVGITATWGWSAVPDTVQEATLIQATRLLKRREAPFGIAGPTGDAAPTVRLLARVDPDVESMLRPYRRVWAVIS